MLTPSNAWKILKKDLKRGIKVPSTILESFQAQSAYNRLCRQARETTHCCTYYRYSAARPADNWFIDDKSFFDVSRIPERNSAILFGSGPSALSFNRERIEKLKEDYLIVGFNFASLLDISFDLYFFEAFGINTLTNKLLDAAHILGEDGTTVVFKSVWMHKYPSLAELARISRIANFSLLRSYNLPSIENNWLPASKAPYIYLNRLFYPPSLDQGYYKEAFTTMLTILPILVDAGIKRIHLVGCDINQDYFFRYPTYSAPGDKKLAVPNEQELPRAFGIMHATASHPIANVVPMMKNVNKYNYAKITIDSAVQGPLSEVLPRKDIK